ncbi:hypothetical protein C8R42DRAFT_729571 [Lentinula raphanica]|nr:hypothetical protein C8R42DRAFT_729571 [Lentinula raphanica]
MGQQDYHSSIQYQYSTPVQITKEVSFSLSLSPLSNKKNKNTSEFSSSPLPSNPSVVESPKSLDPSPRPDHTICTLVHFHPLIRPHVDPSSGQYSLSIRRENAFSSSFDVVYRTTKSSVVAFWLIGRGQGKAPCRYLHLKVDWDGGDGVQRKQLQPQMKKHTHNLGLTLDPTPSRSSPNLPFTLHSPQIGPLPPRSISHYTRRSSLGHPHVPSLRYPHRRRDAFHPSPTLQPLVYLLYWER